MPFTEHLIDEMRNHPCIWNKSLDDYRNQKLRDNVWEQISKEMGKPVDILKGEWKRLQDCYRQAMLRRRTKSGHSTHKIKPWRYEEQMAFLISDLTPRETSTTDVVDDNDENDDSSEAVTENVNRVENQSESENNISERSRKYLKKIKTNHKVDKVITLLQNKDKNIQQPGELDFFFASTCESTKRLPRHLQLRVKQDVMNTVIAAEMEALTDDSFPSYAHQFNSSYLNP